MEQETSGNPIAVIIVLLIFIMPLILSWISSRKRKKLALDLEKQQSELKLAKEKIKELSSKYSPIIDMELHTQRILDEAEEKAASNLSEAERILASSEKDARLISEASNRKASKTIFLAEQEAINIKSESKELNAKANLKLKSAKEKALEITELAHEDAKKIVGFANEQAKEIAGDAYEAKQKADSYETAIRAMRNTIEGYKDDYIIPNHSVLDDLADEFSYKEAGAELKKARKRVKDLVKNGHAGDCDYVEQHRKMYAIHFAVDAFNGKVATALSKVKHDNFGKIKQEIIDAFALVNHNGAPFRNARIRQKYLDARQDELKWAVSAHELRQAELAEQREIKQQIREEERAAREMAKAIKEAEKEERILQKALTKARSELKSANDEERKDFEAQLADLEGKLIDAEERGKRALSMAQQTRRGHVYIISNIGSFGENIFKIGMTRRLEPLDRVKELGDASVPFAFDVHAMLYSEDAPNLEKLLHRRFVNDSVNKVNSRKEFFRTSLAEIKQMVDGQGIKDVHWTLKSEATEYRESLAIERAQQAETVA